MINHSQLLLCNVLYNL